MALLSSDGERHFYRCLMTTDDFGCFEATPAIIKGRCYPLIEKVTINKIIAFHQELEDAGIVRFWQEDGRNYGIFLKFSKHQRVRSTHQRKTPPPPDDICCQATTSDDTRGSRVKNPNLNPNPNPPLSPLTGDKSPHEVASKTRYPDPVPPPAPGTKDLKPVITEIITYLNQQTGKHFKPSSDKTRRIVLARLREGFAVAEFKAVINFKHRQWKDDPQFCEYLRPETLFGTKFESYLNAIPKGKKQSGQRSRPSSLDYKHAGRDDEPGDAEFDKQYAIGLLKENLEYLDNGKPLTRGRIAHQLGDASHWLGNLTDTEIQNVCKEGGLEYRPP